MPNIFDVIGSAINIRGSISRESRRDTDLVGKVKKELKARSRLELLNHEDSPWHEYIENELDKPNNDFSDF